MARQRVIILGATGMLGSMMLDVFVKNHGFDIIATYRNQKIGKLLNKQYPKVDFCRFDAEEANLKSILDVIKDAGWVVNAIGIIKPYIHEDNPTEVQKARYLNTYFPHLLAEAANKTGSRVIQIATDCVFSGQKGQYVETDSHDALDVYGKTKSLGEVFKNSIYHLRCSIIGPQLKGHNSLLDWLLYQPRDAQANGYENHKWNGITTLHFARICYGIIKKGASLPHIQHIIPANSISKANLLESIAKEFKRDDVIIKRMEASIPINRTLSTDNEKLNRKLWLLAGYESPPSIQTMIRELSQYKL